MRRGSSGGDRSAELALAAVGLAVTLLLLAGAVLGLVAIGVSGWRAIPQTWPSWTNAPVILASLSSVILFGLISTLLMFRLRDVATSGLLRSVSIRAIFRREGSSSLPARFELMGGAEFENEMAGLLGDLGYSVQRARASDDKGVDLILKKGNRKVAVQLKSWTAPVGHRAVQAAFEGRIHHGADEAWLVTTSRFTRRAAELARTTGVRLVDGAELAGWLNSSPREV